MNLLFVCTKNKLRSPTGQEVFSKYENINALSAGTNKDSPTPLSGDLIEWANVILPMEDIHKRKITTKYMKLLKHKKIVCLDIPDNYQRMDEELIQILKRKVEPLFR